jgi:glycosyltransferase involved in cell wall biosynthesis
MKILFDHSLPFFLAHGGVQVQVEQTKLALERLGVDVEFVRWWDSDQPGDIIHYFGPVPNGYLARAKQKRVPVILTSFLSEACNRSDLRLRLQGLVTRSLLRLPLLESIKAQLQWRSYQDAAHTVVGLKAERRVLKMVFRIPDSRISIIPLGLGSGYWHRVGERSPHDYLISVGTITAVKRSNDLAKLAKAAEVPILFVGNPYSQTDPYWAEFKSLLDGRWVRYRPYVEGQRDIRDLLLSARGFVLFSEYENWSLAAHEAAACGLPLLLPDMKWSRECFADGATYFKEPKSDSAIEILRRFYLSAPSLHAPSLEHCSWDDVALRLRSIYEQTMKS